MLGDDMKISMATTHVPLKDVASKITTDLLVKKLRYWKNPSFQILELNKPRIAVLGLNPHASDGGLIGDEEEKIIKPAIKNHRDKGMLIYGPYPADGFFGAGTYKKIWRHFIHVPWPGAYTV